MNQVPVSLVVSVKNEVTEIANFLQAIEKLSPALSEVVFVDGGSSDGTLEVISTWKATQTSMVCKLVSQPSTIGQARNLGIQAATYDWIAMTDVGCLPDPDWSEKLWQRAVNESAASQELIVGGITIPRWGNLFEKAQCPFVLILPEKINQESYLPATRSVLFHKRVWQKVGGFNEQILAGEDYAFFRQAKSLGIPILIMMSAVVSWRPRQTLLEFYSMVARMALGDVMAGSWRPKVLLIFGRYVVWATWLLLLILWPSWWLQLGFVVSWLGYLIWSVSKHFWFTGVASVFTPVLQVTADFAVMAGTIAGLARRVSS